MRVKGTYNIRFRDRQMGEKDDDTAGNRKQQATASWLVCQESDGRPGAEHQRIRP